MTTRLAIALLALAACSDREPVEPAPTLSLEAAEPPGDDCPGGGTRVSAGIDDDRDGALSPDEVDTTTLLCGDPVFHGDMVIENDEDALQLVGITEIEGSLTFDRRTPGGLELRRVTRIGGTVTGHLSGNLTAPRLRSIGGDVNIFVDSLEMPALEEIGGKLSLGADAGVRPSGLQNLRTVHGLSLLLVNQIAFDLPALTEVVGDVDLEGAFSFSAPVLTRIGNLTAETRLEHDNRIRSISLPALVALDQLELSFLPISTLYLPALETASFLSVSRCPNLCASVVRALATRTGAPFSLGGAKDC